jgi:hypothetical protein
VNECLRRSVISQFRSPIHSYLYSYSVTGLSVVTDILILKRRVYIDMSLFLTRLNVNSSCFLSWTVNIIAVWSRMLSENKEML